MNVCEGDRDDKRRESCFCLCSQFLNGIGYAENQAPLSFK